MRIYTSVSALVLLFASFASAQPAKLNPCGLLTQAEIKAAVKMEVGPLTINTTMSPAAGALCDFKVGEIGAGGIVLRTMGAAETPQKIFAATEAAKLKTTAAPGVGEGAFYAVGNYGVVQLNAFKGKTHVIVQLMVMTAPQEQLMAPLGQLMATVLSRVK